MEILLIRHGQSEADILGVFEGRADFPLTDFGREQVKLMAATVKKEWPPDLIWASPLKRASETASRLAEGLDCSVIFEDDLMEHNKGVLAGLPHSEGYKYPKPDHLHERLEGGESDIEFRMRIEAVFSKIYSESYFDRIAIVAHGGVINMILRSFYEMPVNEFFGFHNGDTAISLIELSQSRKITHFLNDTRHLKVLKTEKEK